jgi:hypothetical protein
VTHYDAFNGDADGLCALHQLRLASPVDSVLVTGAKRDIALLQRIAASPGDTVTALDISLESNRAALVGLLELGVSVEFFDHHYAGDIPAHPGLVTHIDPAPGVCTGILVDRHLAGAHRVWAVVAAYGDNLAAAARELSAPLALDAERTNVLVELGENLAYNAYGDTEADLVVHPAALYRIMHAYADPFRFVEHEAVLRTIGDARRTDLERARAVRPVATGARSAVYVLPDAAWSRRVRGAIGNELANASPRRAHAVLTPHPLGGYVVSVRAPLAQATGADALCRQFASGGGRAAAAGIDRLPADRIDELVRRLELAWP